MSEPTLLLSSIDRSERYRKEYKRIDKLAESIRLLGLAQPVVVNLIDNKYKLVAGGRRCAALELLGITELTHGLTASPGRAGYVVANELTPEALLEIELEENLQREDTEWYEDVLQFRNISRAHEKKAILSGQPWGQRQAGMLFGVSLGHTNKVLTVADLLISGDKEIQEAGSLENAIRILLGRKEDIANRILAQSTLTSFTSVPSTSTSPSAKIPGSLESLPEIVIDLTSPRYLPNANSPELCSLNEQEEEPALLAPGFKGDDIEIPLSKMFFHGDFRTVMPQMEANSVDHILSDIPYGIDMDNLDLVDQTRIAEEHDVKDNVDLMPDFINNSYRVVKDKGYVIFFYDLDWHVYLQELATKAGFRVQAWPIVWVKTHPCKNNAPGFNFTKTVETAMVLRKGNATLNSPQTRGHIIEDGQIERKLYRNPFAKPFAVWKFLIDAIAIKGQTILDPCAGEMSSCRAMINCGMQPRGIELTQHHFDAGLEGIKQVYNVLTRNQAKFV